MKTYYTSEKNVQMLIYLMKEHGVKRIVASPGTTNVTFVASVQQDPFFEIFSAADERSAAYMACGIAAQTKEPVALTCTGATASRNYIPALTEAFYRKLPVLAITSTQNTARIGNLQPQVIDRTVIQNDIAVLSVQIPSINEPEDEWDCNLKLNRALLALTYRGGGPVHINLTTKYTKDFTVEKLPEFRVIKRIEKDGVFPEINSERVGIFVGAHLKWDSELTKAVDTFCEANNAVVFCDHTSNYHGKYRVQFNLVTSQSQYFSPTRQVDLMIDIGEMSGAYMGVCPKEVWRVNRDGEIRDTFRKITHIFDMNEIDFFRAYSKAEKSSTDYYNECRSEYIKILNQLKDLPFSNAWIAMNTTKKLPKNSILHLGILNSLRNWNFFEIDSSIDCYCNTGGFGIDGIVSSFIGSSIVAKDKLHFLVVGDLAFFYDLNAIANREIGNNIRIILINNGCGTEFKNYNHFAAQFGDDADSFMAARGHYGNQSRDLIRHYSTDLGFKYLSADSKESFNTVIDEFLDTNYNASPILLEIFTISNDESDALKLINNTIEVEVKHSAVKQAARSLLGDKGVDKIKKIIRGK